MNNYDRKLEESIKYLRSRNKYVSDVGCKFVPTKPVTTDVAETIRRYRLEVEKQPAVKLVGRKK